MNVKRVAENIHKEILKNTICADRMWLKSSLIRYIKGLLVFLLAETSETVHFEISSHESKESFLTSVQYLSSLIFVFFLKLTVNHKLFIN